MLLEKSRWLSTLCKRLTRLEMLNVLYSMNVVQTLLLLAYLNVSRFMDEKMKNIPLSLYCCGSFLSHMVTQKSRDSSMDKYDLCCIVSLAIQKNPED